MKFNLLAIVFLLGFALPAMACETCEMSDSFGRCKILYPNQRDAQNRFCGNNKYGVAYNGYFSQNKCYSSISQAIQAMRADSACLQRSTYGNCRILFPFQKDRQNRFCGATTFGVTYNRYLSKDACYYTAAQAIAAMKADGACLEDDRYGNCKIMYPLERDRQNLFCGQGLWGVAYNGYFVENKCYSSAAQAMAVMKSIGH